MEQSNVTRTQPDLVPAGAQLLPVPYTVACIRRELADTVTLELRPASAERPAYAPGQFNMLYAFGIGEIPISICGETPDGGGFLHTVRDVGAVSHAIAGAPAGTQLGLRGPFGKGWPVDDTAGADVVVVAGGLGLAPLRPAIHALLSRRGRYGRIAILAGSRTPTDILYRDELEDWRRRGDVDMAITVDHADRAWTGHVGVVTSLIPNTLFDPAETIAFVCGPEIMMRFTARELRRSGVPAERIHLSMERNMKCATRQCGHCQFGPDFVCHDGPVLPYRRIGHRLALREI